MSAPTLAEVLAAHGGTSFDMGTPRQYTADGGWNVSCSCGTPLCSHPGDCQCHEVHLEAAVLTWVEEQLTGAREDVGLVVHRRVCGHDNCPPDEDDQAEADAVLDVIRGALTKGVGMSTDELDLDALRKVAEGATPDCSCYLFGGDVACGHSPRVDVDAATMLALLDRVEAAEAKVARVEALADGGLSLMTEGADREGTGTWRAQDRDTYSLAIEEAQVAIRRALGDAPEPTSAPETARQASGGVQGRKEWISDREYVIHDEDDALEVQGREGGEGL